VRAARDQVRLSWTSLSWPTCAARRGRNTIVTRRSSRTHGPARIHQVVRFAAKAAWRNTRRRTRRRRGETAGPGCPPAGNLPGLRRHPLAAARRAGRPNAQINVSCAGISRRAASLRTRITPVIAQLPRGGTGAKFARITSHIGGSARAYQDHARTVGSDDGSAARSPDRMFMRHRA
jgi:hypothetical protein